MQNCFQNVLSQPKHTTWFVCHVFFIQKLVSIFIQQKILEPITITKLKPITKERKTCIASLCFNVVAMLLVALVRLRRYYPQTQDPRQK